MEQPLATDHRIVCGDARQLEAIDSDSVELVVTSPPYPMIEMWDGLFAELNPAVEERLDAGDGDGAFEAMHAELDSVWDELERALVPGGIACINIGDATRRIDGSFRVFPNHARIIRSLCDRGFHQLPGVLWRKPSNSPTKFMGSGTLPPSQYVTVEHEHILVFRNGSERRSFAPKDARRYESAYFWEERNEWFSDVWTDVRGVEQALDSIGPALGSRTSPTPSEASTPTEEERQRDRAETGVSEATDQGTTRDRSGAFPFEIPYRLICMYSAYGDTVLDPFWGTGTTSIAALVAARNSVGYDIDQEIVDRFDNRVQQLPTLSEAVARDRLVAHQGFVAEHRAGDEGGALGYQATNYDFPVKTRRETEIQLYAVEGIEPLDQSRGYTAVHRPVTGCHPETITIGDGGGNDRSSVEQTTFQRRF